jgi:hypothetical protein
LQLASQSTDHLQPCSKLQSASASKSCIST